MFFSIMFDNLPHFSQIFPTFLPPQAPQVLLGAMVMAAQVDRTLESQEDRYGRTGGWLLRLV